MAKGNVSRMLSVCDMKLGWLLGAFMADVKNTGGERARAFRVAPWAAAVLGIAGFNEAPDQVLAVGRGGMDEWMRSGKKAEERRTCPCTRVSATLIGKL